MNDSRAAADFSTVRDFPDRISPMVVKELRQGLRARYFMSVFLSFHALLWIIMVTDSQEMAATRLLGMIWWLFAALMLVLLPLRGLSALTEERQANTMDTLVLTHLSAGRIVRGKWLAIAAQISLVAVSVIPYVIMMYLARGMPLALCLVCLCRLWLAGLLLAAVFVSISWNASWLVRAGMAMAALYSLQSLCSSQFHYSRFTPSWTDFPEGLNDTFSSYLGDFSVDLLAITVLGFVVLELAAGKLAPHENHSGPPRALTLLMVTVMSLTTFFTSFAERSLQDYTLWILLLVTLFSLTERMPDSPQPLSCSWRWGPFAPGWKHGVIFCAAAWALCLTVLNDRQMSDQYLAALRFASWLFWGRLLLLALNGFFRASALSLAGIGLSFAGLQAGLKLLGGLLDKKADFYSVAGWIPSPLRINWTENHTAMSFMAWSGLMACVVVVLVKFYLLAKRPNPDSQAESAPESAA